MIKKRHFIIKSKCDESNLQRFYSLFTSILNSQLGYRQFLAFLMGRNPIYVDLTILEEKGKDIGFVCTSFYRVKTDGGPITVARGITGIHPSARGGKLPSTLLCWKYMRYKFMHPKEEVYVVGFMASPILYSMMCNYTHLVYPKPGIKETEYMKKVRNNIIAAHGMTRDRVNDYTLRIQFQVCLSNEDVDRINSSNSKNIKLFLEYCPNYLNQEGILAIIPLSFYNISVSIWKCLVERPIKRMLRKLKYSEKRYFPKWKFN